MGGGGGGAEGFCSGVNRIQADFDFRCGTAAWVHPPRATPSPGDAGGMAAYKCMELQEGVRNPGPAIQREIQEPHFHLITCTSTQLSLELQSHRNKSIRMQKPSRTEGLTKSICPTNSLIPQNEGLPLSSKRT